MKNAIFTLLLVLFLAQAAPIRSADRGEVVDRVIAVVEDKAVLQSELDLEYRNRLMQMKRTALTEEEDRQMRKELLDALVSDLLLSVHAEKVGISVSDDEIYEEVEKRLDEGRRMLGGEEAFAKQLDLEGLTVEQLRSLWTEKIRTRMLSERLMYSEVVKDMSVTEAEVRAYYGEHLSEIPKRPATVSVSQILLLPSASGPVVEEARRRIEEIEKKLEAGADFSELAREFSEGPSAKNGGSIGYVKLEDLNAPQFEAAVRQLTVGETSGPVLTEFGYHLIKLEDVRGEEVLVRHILITVQGRDEDWEATERLADSIRTKLAESADFAAMAERYSSDYKTKESGGYVGEVVLANLPEHFRDAVQGVEAGGIAPVIREERGFRIVKVLGRVPEREYTFEEAREELKGLIERQKTQERMNDYIEGLKEKYYVEIKGES
jgi:peptidyl-prolyl cis-trans isomerase SurA